MPDSYMVQIDLEKLRENRAVLEGRSLTEDDVRDWLIEQGFVPVPKGWVAEKDILDTLDASEVVSCWPL